MLTFSKFRLAVAVLALSGATAQADDLLEQLSGAPPQLVETVTDEQADVQPVSHSMYDHHEAAACTCGECCVEESNCLLSQVFGTVGGLIPGTDLKSDRCFDGFIEPVTNSVFFEDPRSRTRLRFLFINQTIPESTPVLGGGDFQVYGLQATFAINERLSVIAQKDGWINLQADGIPNQDGWANIATGLKYVLVRDVENQFLLSGGFMYEWANGTGNVLQRQGGNVWTPFVTAGKEIGCNTHAVATTGFHLAADSLNSSSWYYSLHLDHALTEKAYALIELNGLHYIDDGKAGPLPFEGGDLINLGSSLADDFYQVTMAFGGAYKINQNWETAAAYEIPLAAKGDIFDERLTFTLSFIY
ncbi:MAG: hypothetical protein ACYTGL_11860 [Planctomycetota bacterium]